MASKHTLIKVPRDLASVTHYDASRECSPEDAGLSAAAVRKIWSSVEAMYRSGLHPGIQLAVRRHGKLVINRAIGHAQGNGPGDLHAPQKQLTPETPICLYSASKSVTAMLAHKMVEQNKLKLDDRVADYIPEYAVQGKGETTLRQLLAHRAGIPSLPVRDIDPSVLMDWDTTIRLLCATKPSSALGQQQSYHAVTAGYIVAELVRRVSGRSLHEILRTELAEPLGCQHLSFGLPPQYRADRAFNYSTGPKLGFPLSYVAQRALGMPFEELAPLANEDAFLSSIVPAANIHSTADESSRFYEMLLRGGEFEGRRVFKPETIAEAIRAVSKIQIDRTLFVPIRFSPGFILGEKPFGLYGRSCASAFGHLGFINIVCWADPERDIAVALLNTGKSMAPNGLSSLGRVLFSISHHCKPLRARSCRGI
ncbi:MAG: serine hydrolase domain-containing protein [Panacagrimonas sp.]